MERSEAFAGIPDPTKPDAVAPDYDDRPTLFTASLSGVSAKEEKIPELPIVALAEERSHAAGGCRDSARRQSRRQL